MRVFSSDVTEGANSLYTGGAWVVLLSITIGSDTFLITNNTADIVYNTDTYVRFPFTLDVVRETIKGDIPQTVLTLPNTNRSFEPYLQANNGGIGGTVYLYIVYVLNGVVYDTWIEEMFSVLESKADAQWVSLTLGLSNTVTKRFPRDRYIATMCRFKFKDGFCRYTNTGDATLDASCEHTLSACVAHHNSVRYGGSPGISEGVY